MLRPQGDNERGTPTRMPKHVSTTGACVWHVSRVCSHHLCRAVDGEVVPKVWPLRPTGRTLDFVLRT